ncbi:MAG: T9SS type A sorting domain-containing protein [Flavobacteriales bacterium]|nr:T9SS type A sorting domain-containing protein [Flavobacteriales bacterium]
MRFDVPCALVLLTLGGGLRSQNICLDHTGFVASGGLDLWGISAGHLNDDTLLDMAVSNHLTGDLSIFFGNGDGSFQPAVTLPVGMYPVDIIAADLNGDTRADLVTAHVDHVQVLLNLGGGAFDAPVPYAIPSGETWTLMARDLDNDGAIDLLVPHGAGGGGLAVLIGNGDGTFQPHADHPTDVPATSLDLADFNEDGHLDVLYTHLAGLGEVVHFWSILWGTRPGTFGTRTHVTHPHTSIFASAIDVDANGDMDVVVSNSYPSPDSLSFRMGDGTGGFAAPVTMYGGISPALVRSVDMDLDGFGDLVVADYANNSVRVFPGYGAGQFGPPVHSIAAVNPIDFAVGRFNADALPDIVIAASSGAYVGVILNCLVAAVEEATDMNVMTLGPNPADDAMYIRLDGAAQAAWIEITDAAGRLVEQAGASADGVVVDTSPLAGGLYVATLCDANGRSLARARFEVVHAR